MVAGLGFGIGGGIVGAVAGGVGALLDRQSQKKALSSFRKRQKRAIASAREFTDQRVAELTGEGSLIKLGKDFLRGSFEGGGNSPLEEQLRKSLAVAQESRGLRRSAISASGEARALGAFSQQLRQQLLPSLEQFGSVDERLRQSVLGFELPIRIGQATGLNVSGLSAAPGQSLGGSSTTGAVLGQAVSGFLGGANLGFGFANQLQNQQQNQELLEQVRIRNGLNSRRDALDFGPEALFR